MISLGTCENASYTLQHLENLGGTGKSACSALDTPIKSKKATENRINNKTTKSFPLWTQRSSR